MLELEEARQRILATIEPRPTEIIPLNAGARRILAADISAPIDLPVFDNSAMDGYAVRAADVAEATVESPVSLRVVGRLAAGDVGIGPIKAGETVRLFTGSRLPAGADAVVMQEDTRPNATRPDSILVIEGVKPWENIRFQGEDVKGGSSVARIGERITPGCLALLGALGIGQVTVRQQPVVGLMATGSELIEPGTALPPGKIYESNRCMLAPLLARAGAVPRILPLVSDTLDGTKEALASAFAECDGVMTSGGVSVGELDFVKAAFERLGGTLDFWQVAVKPGKPFAFGRWNDKYLFGLPGNPVSALVTFLLLVRPALWYWQGASELEPPGGHGVLAEPLANPGNRRHYIRVFVDEHGGVSSTGIQASHRLASLASANALVEVPPFTALPIGAEVRVVRFDD
jgi:molybdopterin molybdotransferase